MNARKGPVPVAPTKINPHVFVGNPYGPRDPIRQKPIECSFVVDGFQCPFPEANGVHKSSEELAEALPPLSPDDRTKEMTGERGDV